MKKFLKALSLMMIMVICFFMTAVNSYAAPAPPVSSAQVVSATIKSDGYVYVTVKVVGYGDSIYSTYDGAKCSVASTSYIGKPTVTGFLYEMKCSKAVTGSHAFTFNIKSINYPWNTVYTSSTITVN